MSSNHFQEFVNKGLTPYTPQDLMFMGRVHELPGKEPVAVGRAPYSNVPLECCQLKSYTSDPVMMQCGHSMKMSFLQARQHRALSAGRVLDCPECSTPVTQLVRLAGEAASTVLFVCGDSHCPDQIMNQYQYVVHWRACHMKRTCGFCKEKYPDSLVNVLDHRRRCSHFKRAAGDHVSRYLVVGDQVRVAGHGYETFVITNVERPAGKVSIKSPDWFSMEVGRLPCSELLIDRSQITHTMPGPPDQDSKENVLVLLCHGATCVLLLFELSCFFLTSTVDLGP